MTFYVEWLLSRMAFVYVMMSGLYYKIPLYAGLSKIALAVISVLYVIGTLTILYMQKPFRLCMNGILLFVMDACPMIFTVFLLYISGHQKTSGIIAGLGIVLYLLLWRQIRKNPSWLILS